jgi:hypothetical protein
VRCEWKWAGKSSEWLEPMLRWTDTYVKCFGERDPMYRPLKKKSQTSNGIAPVPS